MSVSVKQDYWDSGGSVFVPTEEEFEELQERVERLEQRLQEFVSGFESGDV